MLNIHLYRSRLRFVSGSPLILQNKFQGVLNYFLVKVCENDSRDKVEKIVKKYDFLRNAVIGTSSINSFSNEFDLMKLLIILRSKDSIFLLAAT